MSAEYNDPQIRTRVLTAEQLIQVMNNSKMLFQRCFGGKLGPTYIAGKFLHHVVDKKHPKYKHYPRVT